MFMWDRRPSEHSFIRESADDRKGIADLGDDLQSVRSFSHGGAYRLGWRKHERPYATTGVDKVVDTWCEHLRAIPGVRRLTRTVWVASDHGVHGPLNRSAEESRTLLSAALPNHAVSTYGNRAKHW